ncbi:nucleotidyl transferase AbiEii/AbiGii toxin family protein [Argonema antarcticum]|uniref:nucleotidyl transferase AbiEii/AbiGii toxin family protein n=1 Tax=Argonema antarcticum TaxID=2942763 RepID=UPI002011FEF9|nr:nucleotidyl transferase AbiEii/AbiGii toxin family protein [Argonema antarcticum A004/B2]
MKLFEHLDFRDAVIAAREHFAPLRLTEQFIEKDYYVTEALRIVATQWPNQVIFKGGTSLSKGWKLIERFSEDIDLFLNRQTFIPPLGANRVDRELEAIESAVGNHPGLRVEQTLGRRKRGVYRNSYFIYDRQFVGIEAIANRVFLEMGTRSGTYPTQTVMLCSYIAEFLHEIDESLDTEDESSFPMLLLDFRRTFVEKLFTIHSKVVKSQEDGQPIGAYARHYYDLFCLAKQSEVQELLQSEEYSQLKEDSDRISREYFPDYDAPEAMKFSNSLALFPTGELRQTLKREYEQQCSSLCYGNYPAWEEVEACFEELRDRL